MGSSETTEMDSLFDGGLHETLKVEQIIGELAVGKSRSPKLANEKLMRIASVSRSTLCSALIQKTA